MNENKNGFGVGIVLFGVLALVAGFLSTWYVADMYGAQLATSSVAETPSVDTPSQTRDKIRKEHSLELVSRLFVKQLLQKENVPPGQAGLEQFQGLNDQEIPADPLTAKPYVFNGNQLEMVVGEVIFGINSTCDDKIQGSDGTGLIIDAGPGSIALAIKLESGGYSCESHL
jgi:hypothetical protein